MGKPWKRRKKKRDRAEHGPCFVATCKVNGSMVHHCKICEEIEEERKRRAAARAERRKKLRRLPESDETRGLFGWKRKVRPPFKVQFCGHHVVEANEPDRKSVV